MPEKPASADVGPHWTPEVITELNGAHQKGHAASALVNERDRAWVRYRNA